MAYVAIDAGHGLGTPGKRTPDGEHEWSFNNKVALACIAKLQYNGVKILRTDDPTGKTDVPLATRTSKANAAKVDIFVSFHHNANTGSWGTWTGTETFVYTTPGANSTKLANLVQPRILKAYGLRDRGVKRENFHVLRETSMPAILVEGGYMDSTIDIKKLRDDNVLKAAGEAIADGILAYFGITPKSAPVVTQPTPAPTPSKLYRVRKSWADTASQIGAFGELENAIFVAKANPGFNVYDNDGKQVYPEVTPTQPVTPQMYRVRKSWADVKSQIGAYTQLDNAKDLADKNVGYKVYDKDGNEVYVGKAPVVVTPPTPTPTPQPTEPVVSHEGHNDIMGTASATREQMILFAKTKNPDFKDLEAVVDAFLSVGSKYGLRGDVAFCQSLIETGWFKFDGGTAVTPDQHNYCGMGVTSKGMKGNSWANVEDGVTGQIQHLFAYATKNELPAGVTVIQDPRFKYVTRGIAPHWEDLSNRWAMNPDYGKHIVALHEQLLAVVVPVEEPKPEKPPVVVAPEPTEEKINVSLLNKVLQMIMDFFKGLKN